MPRFLGTHWSRAAVSIGLAMGLGLNTLSPAQGQFDLTSSVEVWCALAVAPSQPPLTLQQSIQTAAIAQYRGNFDQFTPDGLGVLTLFGNGSSHPAIHLVWQGADPIPRLGTPL